MPNDITVQQYRPSEIIAIFNEILSRQTAQQSGHLVFIRGIYLASGNQSYYNGFYDKLRDEDNQEEITIFVSAQQRQGLVSGNLVELGGTLGRKIDTHGYIQLVFKVSRVNVVQNQVVDEDEQKRLELRLKKVQKGFKNVSSILESLLYNDKRPKIALVLAQSSITLNDFEDGIRAAKVNLDFIEQRVSFTQTASLISTLRYIDNQGYDAIAMVRGGGIDAKKDVDKPEVIETVVNLKTPFIAATGHKEEVIFLRQVADYWTATPQGLGQYFSELVDSVSEKKSKSRAALTEQIKKQFQQQLETLKKQNKETQEKFTALTKQQEAAQKQHKEQIDAANKQNTKLQAQLKSIEKTNKEQIDKLNETHKTQLTKLNESQTKLQEQLKKQQEDANKRSAELNTSIKKMQETNSNLQKSLSQLTAQNTQAAKDLNAAKDRARELERQLEEARRKNKKGCLGSIAFMLAIISAACYIISIVVF